MQILPIYTKRIERIETTRDERLKDLINVKEACIGGTTFAAGLVTVTATNPEDICQVQHT
jgi:NaMN:DMB phosphoribosyltransferase